MVVADGDPFSVRPNELVDDVRDRLRALGAAAPATIDVTTAKARLLGRIDTATLLQRRRGGFSAEGTNA